MNSVIVNENSKKDSFKIGITGDTDTEYFQLGMSALKTFDSSMFSIDVVEMSEKNAKKALEKGEISAYVVIPKDFIENALQGEIETVKYVTTSGSTGLISIFKTEITKVITVLVAESQKGVYGLADALDSNGFDNISNKRMNQLNIKYLDLILNRSKLYSLETLDISNGLTLPEYYFGSLIIIFLFFQCIPYATIFVKREYSLNKLLASKCFSSTAQITCEYFTFTLSILLLTLFLGLSFLGVALLFNFNITVNLFPILIVLTVVICLITSLTLFIFELSSDIISGILIQFFVGIFMCYISGCIFPIYSMPKIFQTVSPYLPIGIARRLFENALLNDNINTLLLCAFGYIVLFYLLSAFVRKYKLTTISG